jgi:hypothetical protein
MPDSAGRLGARTMAREAVPEPSAERLEAIEGRADLSGYASLESRPAATVERDHARRLNGRAAGPQPIQRGAKFNGTGLPDGLKAGVEALSGISLEGVKVHYNSAKPARLHALAYAQGTDVHLAPGQEGHLPHEAWHVVQQAQGRVRSMQMKGGVPINDDASLEREAEVMGSRAAAAAKLKLDPEPLDPNQRRVVPAGLVVQRFTVAYTAIDMDIPPLGAPAGAAGAAPLFVDQVVQNITHARSAIPPLVKNAVDAFADATPPLTTYNHHVGYQTILNLIIAVCEGEDRDAIESLMEARCVAVGVDPATFGIDPMRCVADFNTWLDLVIVTICDWPNNIFRGAKTNTEPDNPAAPTPALTARLAAARAVLDTI